MFTSLIDNSIVPTQWEILLYFSSFISRMIGPFETFGHKLVVRQTNLLWSSSNWENILEQSGAMLLPLYLIFGWQTNISGYVLHHPRDLFSSGIHFYKNANIFETQISMKFIQKFTLQQLWRQKMFAKKRAIHKKCKLQQMYKITDCFQ